MNEPNIDRAPTFLEWQALRRHMDILDEYREAKPIDLPEWEPTVWDRTRWFVEDVLTYSKVGLRLTPHLVSLTWGLLMKSPAKIATALVGLVAAVLSYFDIVIPESLFEPISVVVGFVIGWLLPQLGGKKED